MLTRAKDQRPAPMFQAAVVQEVSISDAIWKAVEGCSFHRLLLVVAQDSLVTAKEDSLN